MVSDLAESQLLMIHQITISLYRAKSVIYDGYYFKMEIFMKFLFSNKEKSRRLIWSITRSVLETDNYKHRKYGEKTRKKWSWFELLIKIFEWSIKKTRLYDIGYENAKNTVLNRVDLYYEDLPDIFDGYSILHFTDLHLDAFDGISTRVGKLIKDLEVDLCVMTGDFREGVSGGFKKILDPLQEIVSQVTTRDGILAILGNHDTYQMVSPMERMGIRVLANETVEICRSGQKIFITGLDDPYYYYTDRAISAMEETGEGFKLVLAHTPSLYDVADKNQYALYLTGHTHAGQICLPRGIPIILHLRHGRKYYRGVWQYNGMKGITGQGLGTVGIPVRFNTQSEIILIRLLKK